MMEYRDRFVELPLRTSGVYALALQGQVVYIGKSVNVLQRISTHRNTMRRRLAGKPEYAYNNPKVMIAFDRAFVRWAPEDELDRLELDMIEKYKPTLNVRLRRNWRLMVNMNVVAKRMEKWKNHSVESLRGFERRF